nr:hypothetical protein [Chthoniobacterales bacterium]
DLMLNPALDRCLVVGAEEADWLLCDAYRRWHLLRDAPPIQPFQEPPRGMLLSEGAGALLLDRAGPIKIETIDAGCNFWRQNEAALCVEKVFAALAPTDDDLVIASANGTFVDRAERAAILRHCPAAVVYAPKAALGEGVGAGSIWQVIAAAQALHTGALPSSARALESNDVRVRSSGETHCSARRAVVSVCGLNQQVAGLALSL